MDAIEVLMEEHHAVKIMLRVLEKICLKLDKKEEVSGEHISDLLDFLKGFVDKCHHAKEEEYLFPTIRSFKISKADEIITNLLQEHTMGREFVKKMNEEIQKRTDLWETDFITHAKKYIELLNKHIEKEDNNAFKIAEQKLTSEKDAELVELFEEIELERLGIGKHEQYHEMIKKLKVKYLK